MNKKEFKKLDKEQMIIAFNQLKDDYHNVSEENTLLKSVLKKLGDYIEGVPLHWLGNGLAVQILNEIADIVIKGIEENNE